MTDEAQATAQAASQAPDAPSRPSAIAPQPQLAPHHPLKAPIEEWFARHYANSVFSRNQEAGAAFIAAKNDLLAELESVI